MAAVVSTTKNGVRRKVHDALLRTLPANQNNLVERLTTAIYDVLTGAITVPITTSSSVIEGAGIDVVDNGDGSVTVSADGPNITGLNATNIASGTLADAHLSSNVPLKDAANVFTAIPQTVSTTALGDTLTPVSAATLRNTTAATGGVPVQDSPAIVLEARARGTGIPADPVADRPYRAAINLRPNPANNVIPEIAFAFQRDSGSWVSALHLGGPDEYSGIQQTRLYGAFEAYGAIEAINSPFSLRNSGNTTTAALQKKAGTDDVELRSLASTAKIHVLDSASAYARILALELRAYANTFTAGFKAPAALAADRTWTLPLVDAAGVMRSDGSGILSFTDAAALASLVPLTDNTGYVGSDALRWAEITGVDIASMQALAAGTTAAGLTLENTVAATVGNQRWSPATVWAGNGFKTDATAASQAVEFRAYVQPVQNTAAPLGVWRLESRINGGAWSYALEVNNSGVVSVAGQLNALGGIEMNETDLTAVGNLTSNGFDCSGFGSIVPAVDDTGNVGSDALRWNTVRALLVIGEQLRVRDTSYGVSLVAAGLADNRDQELQDKDGVIALTSDILTMAEAYAQNMVE